MHGFDSRGVRVVTVFGGSGFIGRYVVSLLAEAGWQVRVAVRDPQRASFLTACGDVGQVVPLAVDVADPKALAHVMRGSTAVVNLIGILFESGKQRFDLLHAKVPGYIAQIAQDNGVSAFVQMSAIGADANSTSAYGRSKGEGEFAAKASFSRVTTIRPSIVFGPEDDFFNRFAKMSTVSPFLPLIGGGVVKFQPVFVQDVAKAIFMAVNDPGIHAGVTYELGGPRIMTFRECLLLMLRQIHRDRVLLSIPMWIARIQALFLGLLPQPPLTQDQLKMLERDNIVSNELPGFRELGIDPVDPEVVLPTYLAQFRPGGK